MANEPVIRTYIYDVNSVTMNLTGDDHVLVRHYSTAYARMVVNAQGGASINEDMYIIRNGGKTVYGKTGEFPNVVSDEFTFSAEDSEGRIGQETIYAEMVDYVKLTCNITGSKINASGSVTLECDGDYFNDTFGAVRNTLTVRCRYRLKGGSWSGYTTMQTYTSGSGYSADATITGLDYSKSYDFECEATDRLMTVTDKSYNARSLPVFHWSEKDVQFEVPVTVKGDAHITGDLRLKGEGNYGNTLRFGDGNRCYIYEDPDDEMYIHADALDLDVDEFKINGKVVAFPETGEWTPELSIDGGVEYISQSGWYTKTGNVVTVGFYLKATCDEGYEDYDVYITGLPYNPSCRTAGGGMCSGAIMSRNQNFQCFVAEVFGDITIRTQDCDDTAGYKLGTSASGAYYPDGELTLSGTITYMI
jgi:hypothetical protein